MIIIERYRYFNNIYDYRDYLSSIKIKKIGEGSEGEAFLTNDNSVIKVFDDHSKTKEDTKDDIIMLQDYNIPSYYFPFQLQIVDGLIVSYLCNYFPGNVIKCGAPYNCDINEINIDNLLKAYHRMVKDTEIISKDNIMVYDLAFDLLFNNYKLGAVDTFNYYRDKKSTLEDNLESLDYTLLHELHYHDIRFEPDYNESIEHNLKRIKKQYK